MSKRTAEVGGTPKRLRGETKMHAILQEAMNETVHYDNLIKQGLFESQKDIFGIQNSTATFDAIYVDAEKATITQFQPKGLCLDRRQLAIHARLCAHQINREAEFDPVEVACRIIAAHKDPAFPAWNLSMWLQRATVSMFKSGTTVNSGGCMIMRVQLSMLQLVQMMNALHSENPAFPHIVVADIFGFTQNNVVSMLFHPVDVTALHKAYPATTNYNPKKFVAGICILKDIMNPVTGMPLPPIKALCFGRGTAIFSGVTRLEHVPIIKQYFEKMIAPFRTVITETTPRGRQMARHIEYILFMAGHAPT